MNNPIENKINWPDDKSFGLVLTHDVDRVKKTYQYITHFIKTRRGYHIKSLFRSGNPYWTFDAIMELEEKLGVKSTFFFLNESGTASLLKPNTYSLYWGRYKIDQMDVRNMIIKLDKQGWEIGVHGSYNSYMDGKMLAEEKQALEKILSHEIAGIRQHHLRLAIPKTWELQHKVGFAYDSSLGHNDRIGIKDDACTIIKPFKDDFYVVPLTIMDSALFTQYLDLDEAWNKVNNLIMEIKNSCGLLSILWHTERFNAEEFPGHADFYKRIIELCKRENAWIGTCGEAVKLARC